MNKYFLIFFVSIILASCSSKDEAVYMPVSYTHLDVYKRQVLQLTSSKAEIANEDINIFFIVF